MADIELLFGVKGGGDISGPSGKGIKEDLEKIVKAIEPLTIKVEADQTSIKDFEKHITSLADHSVKEAKRAQLAWSKVPPNPGGGGGGGGGGKKKNDTLAKDTTEYYKAVTKLEKMQTSLRENLRKWTGAQNGKSSVDYANLGKLANDLDDLSKNLEKGTLKAEDFEKAISRISAEAARSADNIHFNEENEKRVEKLQVGVIGYAEALEKASRKSQEVKKNLENWNAAETGPTASDYQELQLMDTALEYLIRNLKNGKLTADQFADSFNLIRSRIANASDAIRRANKDMSADAGTKEYNSQLERVNNLLIQVKKNLANWTAAKSGKSSEAYRGLENMATVLEELRNRLLQAGVALDDFDDLFAPTVAGCRQFNAEIKLAGENVKSTSTRIKDLFDKLGVSFTIADAFHKAIEIGQQMVETVTEIDTAMTELKKVTDETDATYDRFLSDAEPRARALGATVADVVSATADFSRLGNNIPDASDLADAAIVYKNVGDGIEDISTASESIISTMQAFKIEAKDAMSIVDSFNAVGM